ncbi:MAG: type I-F CRISPR-associated endoribonuclease Cas6/Csy4 [Methylococcaceae bacterium]|nr:type I-F CRISPR-associated endoribonuclease Cas6/Csy4 [Methylococcaceae bacterium]MDD1607482.1 type I-F CRISPR-associated endoribonuclease Cas6/Csy4 [Methylococcaceae bacterium]
MNYYLEITLLPDTEISPYFLWQKVYQKIHLGLVNVQDSHGKVPIGVSFPAYDAKKHQLGHKLRLFAESEQQLEKFNMRHCLNDLSDYTHLTRVRAVPTGIITSYASYYRIQPKSSNERLARRKAKHEKISLEQAISLQETYPEQRTDAPYINLKSQSNGERFHLFIGYIEQQKANNSEGFSSYGLSKQSTVPIF